MTGNARHSARETSRRGGNSDAGGPTSVPGADLCRVGVAILATLLFTAACADYEHSCARAANQHRLASLVLERYEAVRLDVGTTTKDREDAWRSASQAAAKALEAARLAHELRENDRAYRLSLAAQETTERGLRSTRNNQLQYFPPVSAKEALKAHDAAAYAWRTERLNEYVRSRQYRSSPKVDAFDSWIGRKARDGFEFLTLGTFVMVVLGALCFPAFLAFFARRR